MYELWWLHINSLSIFFPCLNSLATYSISACSFCVRNRGKNDDRMHWNFELTFFEFPFCSSLWCVVCCVCWSINSKPKCCVLARRNDVSIRNLNRSKSLLSTINMETELRGFQSNSLICEAPSSGKKSTVQPRRGLCYMPCSSFCSLCIMHKPINKYHGLVYIKQLKDTQRTVHESKQTHLDDNFITSGRSWNSIIFIQMKTINPPNQPKISD